MGTPQGARTTVGRDLGLEQAIGAAGGVGALARALGLTQPAVSLWKRIPAERVVAVEAATGVSRSALRPDLYPAMTQSPLSNADVIDRVAPEDRARAEAYALLGALVWRAPDAEALRIVAGLKGDDSPFGMARIALAAAAEEADPAAIANDFFALFIGVGRGEFLPYASYYLTGFLHERPLAEVRADLVRLGLAREERIGEPEDHVAILFDVMRALIPGEVEPGEDDAPDATAFFQKHLRPWAERFFADLETTPTCGFYRAVGRAGRLFMEIEEEAMRLPA